MTNIYRLIKKQEKLRQELALVSQLYYIDKLNLSDIGKKLGKSLTWVTARVNILQS
jgi:DNA-directed RNA polymerase specialized sigma subunit